jgi:hypothetical protein
MFAGNVHGVVVQMRTETSRPANAGTRDESVPASSGDSGNST